MYFQEILGLSMRGKTGFSGQGLDLVAGLVPEVFNFLVSC